MSYMSENIAAIASGYGQSGIGIIRISGPDALGIASKIFVPKKENAKVLNMKSYTAHYGHIFDADEMIDECILLYMKGPHSYTGEDVVEIDAHGGSLVCHKILKTICKNGARMAEPGEFTKRAFLNGRMDLSQAEAVMDVIHADNEKALSMSLSQLKGDLKMAIEKMRKTIIHENAFIEYALDDPEHVSLDGYQSKLKGIVENLISELEGYIAHADEGKLIKEGIQTVIVGKPNAGKSSLLNHLLGEERAIVTHIAGTTRDTLEERAIIDGIPLNIVDTAGIHETKDIVEKIGVDKAKSVVDKADLILYVIDQTESMNEDDAEIMELIKDKKVIVLLNKSDLVDEAVKPECLEQLDAPCVSVSIKNNTGVEQMKNILKDMFFQGEIATNQQMIIHNERHKRAMEAALQSLKQVYESILNEMPEDFYTIDLLDAYEQLGFIIGESVHDDLVNEIFADFCTGK